VTNQHPITPPPELVQQWQDEWNAFALGARYPGATDTASYVAIRAAQWGADTELEACCEWIVDGKDHELSAAYSRTVSTNLRNARRPKPPSLKEQALEALGPEPLPKTGPRGNIILNAETIERHRLVRKALEQLDD
jgi:hypothetical protein